MDQQNYYVKYGDGTFDYKLSIRMPDKLNDVDQDYLL